MASFCLTNSIVQLQYKFNLFLGKLTEIQLVQFDYKQKKFNSMCLVCVPFDYNQKKLDSFNLMLTAINTNSI